MLNCTVVVTVVELLWNGGATAVERGVTKGTDASDAFFFGSLVARPSALLLCNFLSRIEMFAGSENKIAVHQLNI